MRRALPGEGPAAREAGGDDAARAVPVLSPCTNVCRMDPRTGWCEGCWRTIDEIAAWAALDEDARRAVLARVAARRAGAGASHANKHTR